MKVAWLRPALMTEDRAFLQSLVNPSITLQFPTQPLPRSEEARLPAKTPLPVTESLLACVRDADVIVGSRFSEDILATAGRARVVIVPFAGPSHEDLAILRQFPQLTVCNSHYNAAFVAEHAMALLLAVAKQLLPYDRALRNGHWLPQGTPVPSMTLAGKTMTVLGYGAIGRRVAALARAFGLRVMAIRKQAGPPPPGLDFLGTVADLETLLPQTDVLVVCLPLTGETRGLLGEKQLALMKPSALLVNVSRGEILQEHALYRALESGLIAGAGIDAWYHYPTTDRAVQFPSILPFHTLPNVLMSPHRAGDTDNRPQAQITDVAQELNRLAEGRQPHNVLWVGKAVGCDEAHC